MNNSIATLTAAARPVTIDGVVYQIRPLSIDDFGFLQAWLDGQWPDPFALVDAEMARRERSPAQERHLLSAALELATRPRPKMGSPEASAVFATPAGVEQVLYLAVRRDRPGFTPADAAKLLPKMSPADFARLFKDSEAGEVLGDAAEGDAPNPTADRPAP